MSARKRWLGNFGVYLAVVTASTFILLIVSVAAGGANDLGGAIFGWLFITWWIAVVGLFALVPYLALLEWLVSRVRHRRLVAVALGAALAGGGLLLSQVGHLNAVSWQGTLVVIGTALLGATFGAVALLPRPKHHVTSSYLVKPPKPRPDERAG